MRLRVPDPADRRALLAAFGAAGCKALPIGKTLEVVGQEPVEVTFFVRTWAARNPAARVEVIG